MADLGWQELRELGLRGMAAETGLPIEQLRVMSQMVFDQTEGREYTDAQITEILRAGARLAMVFGENPARTVQVILDAQRHWGLAKL